MKDQMRFYIKGRLLLRKPYHLKGVGLPNVYLLNGVTTEQDPEHGTLVHVENLRGLHCAIGLRIVEKKSAITGVEFRFLRKQMGLTQVELGQQLSVSDQTIANYEKDKTAPPQASAHMRLLYILHILPPDTPLKLVQNLFELAKTLGFKLPDLSRYRIVEGWQEPERAAAA